MLLWAAVVVAGGTAAGYGRPRLAPFAAWTALALLVIAAGAHRRSRTLAAVVAVLALASTAAAASAWRSPGGGLIVRAARGEAHVGVCGTVTRLRPRSVEVGAERLERSARAWRVTEPVRVTARDIRRAKAGERLCATGRLTPARPGRDEPPLLRADRIERRGIASPLRFAAGEVRRRFSDVARAALPERQAGLLLGMTDGDTELIDDATMERFRTTGLAHLVAVSGSNVAVLLALVLLACRAIVPRGRWLRVLVAAPPLVFFAFLTGLEASVLRATVSAGVAVAVAAGGRTTDALHAAAFAFVALVLFQPSILFHPGFQLSFGATLGLIFWAGPLTESICKRLPDTRPARGLAMAAGTTLAAQLAVAPLLAWHFGRVPALGGVANLIAVPLAGVVMVGGLVTLTAASLVPLLDWTPSAMRLPLDVILWTARVFADVPGASLSLDVLAGGAVTATLAAAAARSRRIRVVSVALLVSLVTIAGGRSLARTQVRCDAGEIRALDVGQGTAVLLRSGEHSILLDGGPPGGALARELRNVGVARLDVAVVSHPHADHMSGLVEILGRAGVGRVVGPVTIGWGEGKRLVAAARAAHVPLETAAAGDVIEAGPIRLEVLAPEEGPAPAVESPDLVNGYSLLVKATLGGISVIAPGDLGAKDQSTNAGPEVAASVLVAPHHGSADLDPGFVRAVGPRLVLVTVGADNPYGHPTAKAIDVFRRYGPVMRTDRHGLVTVCLRDGGAEVWTEKNERVPEPRRQRRPETFE